MKIQLGSPSFATSAAGSLLTRTASKKDTTRRSPRRMAASMAGRQVGAYQAQSGSTPRRESLSGTAASQSLPSACSRDSSAAGMNGMSHATTSTASAA